MFYRKIISLWLVVWVGLFVPYSVLAAGSVTGTVVNIGNNPLPNISAIAFQWNCSGWDQESTATTDATGSYNLNLAEGVYRVTFHDNTGTYVDHKTTEMTVTDGNTTSGIDAQLVLGGNIDGTVTNASSTPVEDIQVTAYVLNDNSWDWLDSTSTDGSGQYNLTALKPGTYRLRFSDNNWPEFYLEEYYNDAVTLEAGTDVQVTAENTTSIPYVINEGGHITGTVIDENNNPLEDVNVEAYFWNGDYWDWQTYFYTGSDGQYDLKGLSSGEYGIEFRSSTHLAEYYTDASDLDNAKKVAVLAGQTTTDIDAQLAPGGFISGTVTDLNANPLQDIHVAAYDTNGDWQNYTYTDNDGNYTLGGLNTGSYKLSLGDHGSVHAKEYYIDQATLETATEVQVTVGQTTSGIDAQLDSAGHITGTVILEDNSQPLSEVNVTAYQWNGNWWEYIQDTRTDDAGHYDLNGLGNGNYRVQFSCDNSDFPDEYYNGASNRDDATDISVTAGNTTANINVQLGSGRPSVPSNFAATVLSQMAIALSWDDKSDNETGFNIFRNGTELTPSPKVAANTTSFNDTGLLCETDYTYQLIATNDNGDSAAVSINATTQACAVPSAPTNLTATAVSGSQINLNWMDSGLNETGFKIFRNGTELTPSPKVAANTTSFNDTGLSCGTTYNYELKATNVTGDSASISASATTQSCPPAISSYTLTIKTTGTGTGIIEGTKAGRYTKGKSITLTAVADSGSEFKTWTPAICGETFRLISNITCTAEFELEPDVELVTGDFCKLNPDYSECQIFNACKDNSDDCIADFKIIEFPNPSTPSATQSTPAVAIDLDLSKPSAAPLIDIVGLLASFTAHGENLSNETQMVVEDCENMQLLAGGNDVKREFFCTQLGLPGTKKGVVKNQNGEVLYDFEVNAKYDCRAVKEIPISECETLSELYNETNGKDWKNAATNKWLIDITPCGWDGITCANEHVTQLRLAGNNLSGNLPDICPLTQLEELDLSNNNIQVQIPSCLSNLKLANDDVVLHNEPPVYVNGYANPTTIHVGQSIYFESAWSDAGEHIVEVQVQYCLQGAIDCEIVTLDFIEGTDEPEVGFKIEVPMNQIGIYDYQFRARDEQPLNNPIHTYEDGSIVWQGGGTFTVIDDEPITPPPSQGSIYCTQVTEIPQAECEALVALYNSTQGQEWKDASTNNWLKDIIPCGWSGITCENGHVTAIDLSDNQLSGSIPDLTELTALEIIDLSDNQLSGSIPDLTGLTALEIVDLSDNQLSGSIPDLSALPALKEVHLSNNNQLDGSTSETDSTTSQMGGGLPTLPNITSNGSINGVYNNGGGIVTEDFTVEKNSSISNLTVKGKVTNHGMISNVTIGEGAELIGGKLSGYITNHGLVSDFEFVGASLIGGTLSGHIYNNSKVGGRFIDVTLLANTVIDGGILQGEIQGDCDAPALLKNVTVKKGSVLTCVELGDNVVLEEEVSLVALPTVAEVIIPEPETPETPKICEASKPSNAPATINGITGELYLPQVRINTQYGNVYSIKLTFQSASVTHFTFKLTDFCQFEAPFTIADGENTAIFNDTKGIIYIPSIDADGITVYTNLYIVKTEGWWIFEEKLDDLVGEESILDYNKEVTFVAPMLEVIRFSKGGPLVPLIDTLSFANEIELSSGIFMINAILDKFENPLDPEGIYWKLGNISPKLGNELTPEVIVQESFDLAIWKHIGQDDYKFTLQYYYNPNDPNGYYWRYVECPTLDKKYLSPGSLFTIDNASCRQKADMHIFITSVFPDLIHLSNKYRNGIDGTVKTRKFIENTVDTMEKIFSVASDIQDIARKNKIKHEDLQGHSNGFMQEQIVKSAKIVFGEENEYIVEGIVHTVGQVFTALEKCNPGTAELDGCAGLFIDLTGDAIGIFNNFAASIQLNANTKRLNSVTCTLDYLTKYYGFGGNKKMLAESVGLSQDASNFVIEEVLAKKNVCNSSKKDYTLSLIERYQEQIRTLNSFNYISQKLEP